MARSDLLISLVKAGSSGDYTTFRRVVESLIAEERAKNHGVLAERLTDVLQRNGSASAPIPATSRNGTIHDLCVELNPAKKVEDLILPDLVRSACYELCEEHNRTDLLRSYGLLPRNRLLLAGAPGNGKTSLAESIANLMMVPFIVVRYDGLIASYLGETASRLKRLFDYIRTRGCVLFFDEFDTIGKERGDEHETGEIKRVVSSLLLQVDDLPSHVIVIAATNHPELLDRAVWRRFQLRLELPTPTRELAIEYFEKAARRLDFSLGYSPRTLADKLKDLSFAELEEFVGDVSRRYVLSLPDADAKQIVSECLKQWNARFSLR
jgi:SpoVK/Ycf46/Vps4 family AAA+-type ATPase